MNRFVFRSIREIQYLTGIRMRAPAVSRLNPRGFRFESDRRASGYTGNAGSRRIVTTRLQPLRQRQYRVIDDENARWTRPFVPFANRWANANKHQ